MAAPFKSVSAKKQRSAGLIITRSNGAFGAEFYHRLRRSRSTLPSRGRMRRCRRSVAAEDDGQTFLARTDNDDLRIATEGEFLGRLDSFPLEKVFVDPFGDDFLETGDAFGLDLFAFGFLFFLKQNKLHPGRFLFGAQFFLNGLLQAHRQADIAQQHPLDDYAARLDRRDDVLVYFLAPLSRSGE